MCQLEAVTTNCSSCRRAIPFVREAAWFIGSLALTACGRFAAQAQHPNVSKTIAAEANAREAAADQRSDEAFAGTRPVIRQWVAKVNPCFPGAAEPKELPQASIPACPTPGRNRTA